jgi:TolB-like protein/Flp pilus assembly protein TadD
LVQSPPDVRAPVPVEPSGGDRLDSWKAIATYLERDVATVRRWEKREALPVHRHHHDKLGSVYAYSSELDAWRQGRRQQDDQNRPPGSSVDAGPGTPPVEPVRWTRRRIVLGSALLALLLAGLAWALVSLARPATSTTAGSTIRSLAVLPLQPLGDAARDEALELGMTDALITRLSNVAQIQVRPMSAMLQYAKAGRDPGTVGRELRVDALVEGKIQRSGDRIRISVQLLRVRDGASLWAGTFDEQFTNIFAVQDSIAQQVARALPLSLSSEEIRGLTGRDTNNALAYQLYLKGRYFRSKRTTDGLTRAVEHFEQAINLDPTYAAAHAGLADSLAAWSNFTIISSKEAYLRARAAALKALELDETLADAHTTLGVVHLFYGWDWPAAEKEFQRAIALEPDDATGHRHYALGLMWLGRFDEAIREIQRARELAPVDVEIHHNLALILYFARRNDQAISEARKTLELDTHFPQAHRTVGKALVEKGLYDQAIAEFHTAIGLGGSQILKAEIGHAYGVSGRRGEALKILAELEDFAQRRHVSPYDMAIVHLGLGETDQAFFWLERSFAQRERWMLQLEVAPFLDPLRADARFADLIRRVGVWQ